MQLPARGVCVAAEARARGCLGEAWWEPYSSSEVDVQSEPCCRRRVPAVSALVPEARMGQSSTQHRLAAPGALTAQAGAAGRTTVPLAPLRPEALPPEPQLLLSPGDAGPRPAQRHTQWPADRRSHRPRAEPIRWEPAPRRQGSGARTPQTMASRSLGLDQQGLSTALETPSRHLPRFLSRVLPQPC